jgi:hypothetical protein
VTRKMTYNDYWNAPIFKDKKPVRNGSKVMMLGDNIYFKDPKQQAWAQAHSHHSNSDGTVNLGNLNRDTKSNYVLASEHFFYFGTVAPVLPPAIMDEIGYKNGKGHRVYELIRCKKLVDWLEDEFQQYLNLVAADPFDFKRSHAHYSYENNSLL